jgi:hypothetical protein
MSAMSKPSLKYIMTERCTRNTDALESNLDTRNGNAFRGILTKMEAKYSVYKESLKLDLANFDGVRFGKGGSS